MNLLHSIIRFDNVAILCNKVGQGQGGEGGGGRGREGEGGHRWRSKPFESDLPLHLFFLDHWLRAQLPALGCYPERIGKQELHLIHSCP